MAGRYARASPGRVFSTVTSARPAGVERLERPPPPAPDAPARPPARLVVANPGAPRSAGVERRELGALGEREHQWHADPARLGAPAREALRHADPASRTTMLAACRTEPSTRAAPRRRLGVLHDVVARLADGRHVVELERTDTVASATPVSAWRASRTFSGRLSSLRQIGDFRHLGAGEQRAPAPPRRFPGPRRCAGR